MTAVPFLATLCALATCAAGQLSGNVIDYAHMDCTNRPQVDVHSSPLNHYFSFDAQQVQGHICMMVISTPTGMSYVRNLVTELDYSIVDTDIDQSTTDLEVMRQFNLTDAELGSLAVPDSIIYKPCIGPRCTSAGCYFPFQCMPCTGLCSLSVTNWCRTNSLCSMVSPDCFSPCVKACVKYYSCTCPQSSQTLGCPHLHTLRLEQPLVLTTDALVNHGEELPDQIVNWCFPTAQSALIRLYVKNFLGHILHCAQFVAKFG